MRTTTRDQDGTVKGFGRFAYSGVLWNGGPIPFTIMRVAVGQFRVVFDPGYIVVSAQANTDYGAAVVYGFGAGQFSINTPNSVGTLTDISSCTISWTCRKMTA